jgi:hypothetical protein
VSSHQPPVPIPYTQSVRRALLFLAFLPLFSQDNAPRSKPADYPVHVSLPGMEIAAEYLLHSIPTPKGFYFTKEYLVVDVGIFPGAAESIKISSGQFTLRINHGQSTLPPDSPGTVAASLKYPDWEQRPTAVAQAGPVILGAPPAVGRFPGDPREPPPISPPGKEEPDPSSAEREPPKTIEQMIALAALPEGPSNKPAKGCLFFRFRGKTKSIRSLDLVYDAGEGGSKATITLF